MKQELVNKIRVKFPHFSDEKVEAIARALYQLSIITYKINQNETRSV